MEYINKYKDVVATVAYAYWKRHQTIEREDIVQELWLWFSEHPNKLADWESSNDDKKAIQLVAKSLRNAAHDYCVKEKARQNGYDTSDIFWYKKDFIKKLLPAALSNDYHRIIQTLGEGTSTGKSPSESGDWMAYASDIRSSFEKLTREEQELVYNFYAVEVDGNSLHEMLGSEKPTARATMMAANRALNKMVKTLGGFKPFYDPDIEPPQQQDEEDEHEDDMQ